jgi:hypothetical protein
MTDIRVLKKYQCVECGGAYTCTITMDKMNKFCDDMKDKNRIRCLRSKNIIAMFMPVEP